MCLLPPFQELHIPDGVHIDHVTCGSAHSISWSSVRRKIVCKLPDKVPMEYNYLQDIPIPVLRDRLILLHHFSNQFCKSLSLFGLQPNFSDVIAMGHEAKGMFGGFDCLRYILLSNSKACWDKRSSSLLSPLPSFFLLLRLLFSTPPLLSPPPLFPLLCSLPLGQVLFSVTFLYFSIAIVLCCCDPINSLFTYRRLRSDESSRPPCFRASSMAPALNLTASK